jgi:hypothetical protein
MQVTVEQAVKEVVDFVRSRGSGSVSSSGPANHAAYAEIRNLAAPGNQSMTCAERESTKAGLNPLQHTMPWRLGQILLSPDTISYSRSL